MNRSRVFSQLVSVSWLEFFFFFFSSRGKKKHFSVAVANSSTVKCRQRFLSDFLAPRQRPASFWHLWTRWVPDLSWLFTLILRLVAPAATGASGCRGFRWTQLHAARHWHPCVLVLFVCLFVNTSACASLSPGSLIDDARDVAVGRPGWRRRLPVGHGSHTRSPSVWTVWQN